MVWWQIGDTKVILKTEKKTFTDNITESYYNTNVELPINTKKVIYSPSGVNRYVCLDIIDQTGKLCSNGDLSQSHKFKLHLVESSIAKIVE